MVLLRYYLKFKDELVWTEVGSFVHTSNTSPFNVNLCSTGWKSVTNTANFTLNYNGSDNELYVSILNKLIAAQKTYNDKVECQIKNNIDGKVEFYGFVDLGKLSFSSGKLPQSISISANDHIILLDEKIKRNKILSTDKLVGDAIDWMLETAGLPKVSEWDDGIRNKVLEIPFVTTVDDDFTYRDKIDTMLQEYGGYVLVSNPASQGFSVIKINGSSRAASTDVVGYMVSSRLKSDTTRFSNDGVVVKFSNVKESKSDEKVYMKDISLSDGKVEDPDASVDESGKRDTSGDGTKTVVVGEVIGKGGYFPIDSDVTQTYWEYDSSMFDVAYNKKQRRTQNSSMGIYYVDPNTTSIEVRAYDKDDNEATNWYENIALYPTTDRKFTYPAGGEWHPRKAWQILHNKSNKIINVKACVVYGKAYYRDAEYKLISPVDCTDPFEYESSYISKESTAAAFSKFLLNLKKFGGNTSQWTGRWDDFALGKKVIIKHKTNTTSEAAIVKKTMKVIGGEMWCDYVAVTTEDWIVNVDYIASITDSSIVPTTAYQQWLAQGNTGTYQNYLDTLSFSYEYMWSSSPDYVDPDAHIFKFGGKFVLVNGIPVGDFEMQDWSKVIEAKTSARPYLWCRVNKGNPFRVTGETGAKGETGDAGKSYIVANISVPKSYTLSQWTGFCEKGHVESWSNVSNWNEFKTGDTLEIQGTISDLGGIRCFATGRVDSKSENRVVCVMNGDLTYAKNGTDGIDAEVFVFKASSTTYKVNKRASAAEYNEDITMSWDVSGYVGTPTVSCETYAGFYNATTKKLSIPLNTTYSSIVMKATLAGVGDQYITLNAVDKTEYNKYLGDTTSGQVDLVGDCYYNGDRQRLEVKSASGWLPLNDSSLGLKESQISYYCSLAQKDVLSKIEAGSVLMADYAYFNTIIANCITANYIGAMTIEIQNNGVIASRSYTEGSTGFSLNADGTATFENVTVKGGNFDCGAFSSMPKQTGSDYSTSSASTSQTQFEAVKKMFSDNRFSPGVYYNCSCSDTSKGTVAKVYKKNNNLYTFHNSSGTEIGYMQLTYESFGSKEKYSSSWNGIAITFTIKGTDGAVFKLKDVHTSITGLSKGEIYADATTGALYVKLND